MPAGEYVTVRLSMFFLLAFMFPKDLLRRCIITDTDFYVVNLLAG